MGEAPSQIIHTPESDLVLCLQDIYGFSKSAEKNPRMFSHIVFATFGAIQAGMILARGKGWVEKPHIELEREEKPRAKGFIKLYKELQDAKNWEGLEVSALSKSTSWDSGVNAVKDLRDHLEHPKYDGTHLACLFIQQDCLRGLSYLDYLAEESPRIRQRFASRHSELIKLLQLAMQKLEAVKINQTETISLIELDPDTEDSLVEGIINELKAKGSITEIAL